MCVCVCVCVCVCGCVCVCACVCVGGEGGGWGKERGKVYVRGFIFTLRWVWSGINSVVLQVLDSVHAVLLGTFYY